METKRPKNIMLLILAAFFLLPLSVKAENAESSDDQPGVFPTDNARWEIRFEYEKEPDASCTCPIWTARKLAYYLSGDTVIDDVKYNKLYCDNIHEGPIYVGATRVEDKRVYFKPYNIVEGEEDLFEEYLLYDFSLKAGDNITLNVPVVDPDYYPPYFIPRHYKDIRFTVESIENREYGRYFNGLDWIEGIGSIKGLWYANVAMPTGLYRQPSIPHLESFSYKGKRIYYDPFDYDKGCCTDGVEDNIAGSIIKVMVVENALIIEALNLSSQCYLYVSNANGVVLKKYKITENNTVVNTYGMQPGIYIYRLSGTGINQSGKLVIK